LPLNRRRRCHGAWRHLVNNAAHQATFKSIEDISDEEWELTFRVNIHAMFYLTKAAVPHMKEGSAIINTASINADVPNPTLLAYATTKGAIQNFTAGLAQLFAEKGIRGQTRLLQVRSGLP
jgi:NAD(P)-dependent dehydrogenase (short-subunit alcohol dehydrogenase family)